MFILFKASLRIRIRTTENNALHIEITLRTGKDKI